MSTEYTVLLYSHDPAVRRDMRSAVGDRPAADVLIEYVESADYDETVRLIDEYEVDLLLLDGEAQPAGGLGVARQLRDELDEPPTSCVILARSADEWLGAWSRADATLTHPLDPVETGQKVVDLLRKRTVAKSA